MNGSDLDDHHADDGSSAGGGSNGAKYKLMSPAKLPISRAPCITVPSGLSPTSFLESPVLLPDNMKAERSPTTGSFCFPPMMHGSVGSSMFSSSINCSNDLGGSKSNCFEFKPQSGSNSVSCLHIAGSLALADMNQKPSAQTIQLQSDIQSQSAAPHIASSSELAASSSGPGLPAARHMATSNGNIPAEADSSGHASVEVQLAQLDHKGAESSIMSERASEDGYNWRKYGQKLVKGSEFPRSYYKCTHPSCEVKKLFERSPDGPITDIIYKGRHVHPKPLPSRRISAGSMIPIQEERSEKFSSLNCQEDMLTSLAGHVDHTNEPSINHEVSPRAANDTNVEGGISQSNRISDDVDDDDDRFSKRRKMEIGTPDISSAVKPFREPRVVVQTLSEVDILDDGYRWRKYGQKVVRGNPNPRSYYKCTSAGCSVRKHVERASHDPKAVITTYEGKHNHDVPIAKTSSHDTAIATSTSMTSRITTPREGEAVSLNLGVGINSVADGIISNRHTESAPGQTQINSSNFLLVQATPIGGGTFPGYVNGGMMLYGSSRDTHVEGHSIRILTRP